jgi:hypothetical protein
MPGTEHEHPAGGSQGAAVSNAVVRLMSEYTGAARREHTPISMAT